MPENIIELDAVSQLLDLVTRQQKHAELQARRLDNLESIVSKQQEEIVRLYTAIVAHDHLLQALAGTPKQERRAVN